ncbi:MAG: hypothetical protein AB2421_08280 [Thermotaleaceae bacterium]
MKEMCNWCKKWFESFDLYVFFGDKLHEKHCIKCYSMNLPNVFPRSTEEEYHLFYDSEDLFKRVYHRKFQSTPRVQRKRYTFEHIKKVEWGNGYLKVQFDHGSWWCLFPLVDILKELNELFGDIEHYRTTKNYWVFSFKSWKGKPNETPDEALIVFKDDYSLHYKDKTEEKFRFQLFLFEIDEWARRDYSYYEDCLKSLPEVPKEGVE